MLNNLDMHPCFSEVARHRFGRVHLPVAPKCNIQCNYCDRRYDCVAESRPGVCSTILSPVQALSYLEEVMQERKNIAVTGIAGPGDPFANPQETMETLRLVRSRFPEMLLCVSTNGLKVMEYLEELAELRVSHLTITINAVDASIGEQIYAWVRDGVHISRGIAGAALLLERQLAALQRIKELGMVAKVNTIILPGINEYHVAELAQTVSSLGADLLNCVPLYPVESTPFVTLGQPNDEIMSQLRKAAEEYLPQMRHCTRCRADAVGMLGEEITADTFASLQAAATRPLFPAEDRPYVAVISQEGMLINQHLGEAQEVLIYEQVEQTVRYFETRHAPCVGGGDSRWERLSEMLMDCRALLVNQAGEAPRRVLKSAGIRLEEMEGLIEDGVMAIYVGKRIAPPRKKSLSCAAGGCTGNGTGCG